MNVDTVKDWRKELDRILLEMRDALWDGPTEEEYAGAIVGDCVEDIVFFTVYKKNRDKAQLAERDRELKESQGRVGELGALAGMFDNVPYVHVGIGGGSKEE